MVYNFNGIPIFKENIYIELCNNVGVLKRNGYKESTGKPLLYYRRGQSGEAYFADMRGTDIVPIWSDPCPLFYAQFPDKMPYWKRSRLASIEFEKLKICRLSNEFDSTDYCINSKELGVYMSKSSMGYCIYCGKDIQDNREYCDLTCALEDHLCFVSRCRICNRPLDCDNEIEHHLDYEHDITIMICRSCHLKIHRGKSLSEYLPVDAPQKPQYLLSM